MNNYNLYGTNYTYFEEIQRKAKRARFKISNEYYPFSYIDEVFIKITNNPMPIDIYWVSNYGKIYNEKTDCLMKTVVNPYGYVIVDLIVKPQYYNANLNRRAFFVHKLVASEFISPQPSPNHVVNHKDFDKQNNYYKNLEWVTQPENLEYSRAAGHYWNEDGSYKANVYGTETVRKLCELLQSGITDPQQLSKIVFNKEPTPGIYSLIRQIKSGKNWGNISRDYVIPDVEHRNFTDDSMIHNICRYFQDHPDRVHGPNSIGAIELAQYIGVNRETMTEKEWRRYISALNQIRNKKAYARIVSQYKF